MALFWITWLQPLILLLTTVLASPSGAPFVLAYPGNPPLIQAHGHLLPIAPPPTYSTHAIGVPVVSGQSSFFFKSLPPVVTPVLPPPVTPVATPVGPLPAAPPPRSVPVPTLLVYSDGSVVPLSDTHHKFPPIVEGFVNRVQNYFSNYAQVDPHHLPFPTAPSNSIKGQKLTLSADNSSEAAITTTTTTTTTARNFGNALNLRLLALTAGRNPAGPSVSFTRTSTVPTSSGRTAKLVEVFSPGNVRPAGLVQSSAEDNGQTPLAVATATATVNFDREGNVIPSSSPRPNRPLPEFVPEGSNSGTNQNPTNYHPSLPAPQPGPDAYNPTSSRPRPEKHPSRPQRPDSQPSKGYRYERPQYRPFEYDVPPKPLAYVSKGPF